MWYCLAKKFVWFVLSKFSLGHRAIPGNGISVSTWKLKKDGKLHWNRNHDFKNFNIISHMRKFLREPNKMLKFKNFIPFACTFFSLSYRLENEWRYDMLYSMFIENFAIHRIDFHFSFRMFCLFFGSIFPYINFWKWKNNQKCVWRNILIDSIP